jgi:eukaryotic-like serine/threonine-protein kinase
MRHSDLDLGSRPQAEPAPALARGTALGRFIVLGLVGRGAMGEVYGAYDPDLDRKIAIKLLRARTGEAPDNRARLMREAKATAKISHPNVVVVYDAGTFGERVFIAMEFIEGHTLRYWLQAQERTWHEALDAFLAAGRGLAAAHDKELVHRDFKPDNVMVTAPGGHIRVMDFGLARFIAGVSPGPGSPLPDFDGTIELAPGALAPPALPAAAISESRDQLTATGAVLGTPAYMSPEQFRSQPADARSDQFSFCVALYEALYGRRPFGGRTLLELSENVVAGRVESSNAAGRVPAWVRPILARGLSARPDDRFPSMNALLDELSRHSGAGRTGFARGAAAKLAGVWEAPVAGQPVETPGKEAMRVAFVATGKSYANASFNAASVVLDRFTQRWCELYVEVCEATHIRGDQSAEVLDLRMACLNEGLDDLRALCRLFTSATVQVVENAVRAAHALGTLERCSDIKLLRAIVRPPDDAETRAKVDLLRHRLVDVRAHRRVGEVAAGRAAVEPLVEEARRVGYGPILAEVLLVMGELQIDASLIADATTILEDAFSTAVQGRHDEVAATAATLLLYQHGYITEQFDVAEVWNRSAEALLRRLGGHDEIWGWYLSARASMRQQQGRLAESIADGRAAVAAQERAFGPTSDELAMTVGNLANHLAHAGDFAGALEAGQRALDLFSAALGPGHPRPAFFLANQGQFLWRLGRIDEAMAVASKTLDILAREMGFHGISVTVPMRTLGLCHLDRGEWAQAIAHLSRALTIRQGAQAASVRLAEVRFPLARALAEQPGQRRKALAMAEQARREYLQSKLTPLTRRDLADLERWLADRAKGARKGPDRSAPKRAKAPRARPTKGANAKKKRRTNGSI